MQVVLLLPLVKVNHLMKYGTLAAFFTALGDNLAILALENSNKDNCD